MRVNRVVLATVATMALAAAGTVTWLVTRGPAPPVVNQAQARAMTPAIDAYLADQAVSRCFTGHRTRLLQPRLGRRPFLTRRGCRDRRTQSAAATRPGQPSLADLRIPPRHQAAQ